MPNQEVEVGEVTATPPALTGERTVPGLASENYWFRRHEVAYEWLAPRVAGQLVLDVGCGLGYGTARLASTAVAAVGLDYDPTAVTYAAGTYGSARCHFAAANLAALPVRDAAVGAVTALQLIEHVWDHAEFLRECRRVLRPGAELVLTTPNRLTFSPGSATPQNPFHTVEFTAAELQALVAAAGFRIVLVAGVHAGPRLQELDRNHAGSFVSAQLAAPPQEWSAGLAADVARISTADFTVEAAGAGIDESLDLVVVATH